MTVQRCGARLGAAAFAVGVSLVVPAGIAAGDTGDTGSETAATAVGERPAARVERTRPTINRQAKKADRADDVQTRQASAVRRTPAPAAARSPRLQGDPSPTAVQPTIPAPAAPSALAAPNLTAAPAVQTFLTTTADWLATLPANPLTEFLQGAVYLVRRDLFPASVGVVTAPIVVPLQLTNVNGTTTKKLGIYATLGSGSTTPQIFELDTGGPGFYVAYASNPTSASPWWGNGVVTTTQPIKVEYDSGNVYQGYAATAQVSLYAPGGVTPLITTARSVVGQMDLIEKIDPTTGEITRLWGPSGQAQPTPPISQAFYGDFGLSPAYAPNGVTNLLAQLVYANGVLPGYRLRTDARGSWLQIGLTAADVNDQNATFFPMIVDPNAPGYARNPYSALRYYGEQLFDATITISKSGTTVVNTPGVGITPDTGAQPTLHNTNRSPLPYPTQYAGITDAKGNALENNLRFVVTATTTAGTQGTVYDFNTTDTGVSVQNQRATNSNPAYYFNTGLELFYLKDVIYYFGDTAGGGQFGLVPR